MPRQALIVGLGLIGGSAAIRLRERGWRIQYIDPHIAPAFDDFERALDIDEQSIVVLATPADVAVEILTTMRPRKGPVTSVCSVMEPLRRAATGKHFVAGHPLAGSEQRGFAAAQGTLFEGVPWFLDTDDAAVRELVFDCGAVPEVVDPAEHDRAVALTSHLPQVLSTALAAHLDSHDDLLRYAGTGLRTFLRLAGSDATVWKPVLEANRDNITAHAGEVSRLATEILEGDLAAFEQAQRVWDRLTRT
jgi:prephenate dehydrogenase